MKTRQAGKQRARHQPRYRISWQPDYGHEIWLSQTIATPSTHPDAFVVQRVRVNPMPVKLQARKKPHKRLSIGALKRRIYGAGIANQRASAIAREIHAGPASWTDEGGADWSVGELVMGWPVRLLMKRFGRRIARAVMRFVSTQFVVRDECWSLLELPRSADSMRSVFSELRKRSTERISVSQDRSGLSCAGAS